LPDLADIPFLRHQLQDAQADRQIASLILARCSGGAMRSGEGRQLLQREARIAGTVQGE
jgi:hypothetical protein